MKQHLTLPRDCQGLLTEWYPTGTHAAQQWCRPSWRHNTQRTYGYTLGQVIGCVCNPCSKLQQAQQGRAVLQLLTALLTVLHTRLSCMGTARERCEPQHIGTSCARNLLVCIKFAGA